MFTCGLLRLLRIYLVYVLTEFYKNLSSIFRENTRKPLKKPLKIAYLWVEFSPRRRQVGKNLMRPSGKEIFRRFRISNQIFGSYNRSRDIERSLDTILAVFSKIWTLWMNISRTEEDLDVRFFANASYRFPLPFGSVLSKSLEPFSRKSRKTIILTTFLYFMDEPAFFRKNRRVSFLPLWWLTFMQKMKKILRAVFSQKWLLTNY